MIQRFANFVKFLIFFTILVNLLLLGETAFCELSNLHFVVTGIEELTLILFDAHTKDFYFLWESFDLDGLEDHDKLYVLSEIGFLVVGEVLDAWPECKARYLRRSSP